MLRETTKQMSFFSVLYDRIPENHLLKGINKAVDFSFINELLEDSYCKNFGRPAKEPEMIPSPCPLEPSPLSVFPCHPEERSDEGSRRNNGGRSFADAQDDT